MNHAAIDFRRLMREEKKRAQQKQKGDNGGNNGNTDMHRSNPSRSGFEPPRVARIPSWAHASFSPQSFPSIDRKNHCVCRNPSSIYYLNNFLSSSTDRDHLISWLQQLESNPSNGSRNSNDNDNDNEQDALGRWTTLPHAGRRVALFDARGKHANANVFPEPLQSLAKSLVDAGIFDAATTPPNHILINEYAGGHQGILPHTDGPAYYHKTATISLSPNAAASVLLNFTPRGSTLTAASATTDLQSMSSDVGGQKSHQEHLVEHPKHVQVLLKGSGSLVVFEDDAYIHYLHSIDGGVATSASSSAAPTNTNTQLVAETCVNALAGTTVSTDYRMSLTFRHKYD